MLLIKCPNCKSNSMIPPLNILLELKGDKMCPFIHYENCCNVKKLKIVLKDNNGVTAEFVDI